MKNRKIHLNQTEPSKYRGKSTLHLALHA